MAELAGQSGLAVEVARFEEWEAAGRVFDAVVAGQAWHWVDPVAGAAKAAEVLRPGGRLALFWNVFQVPPEVGDAFADVYRQVVPDLQIVNWTRPTLEAYSTIFAKAAEGIRAAGAFAEGEEWRFAWDRLYSRDEWLEQLPTFGGANRIPPDRMTELLAGVGAAIDGLGGRFTMGYTTMVVTARRAERG
jgi:SAM-dependent methyltransferase